MVSPHFSAVALVFGIVILAAVLGVLVIVASRVSIGSPEDKSTLRLGSERFTTIEKLVAAEVERTRQLFQDPSTLKGSIEAIFRFPIQDVEFANARLAARARIDQLPVEALRSVLDLLDGTARLFDRVPLEVRVLGGI